MQTLKRIPLRPKVIEVIEMTNYFERRGIWEHPVTKVSRCIWVWLFIVSFSLEVSSRDTVKTDKRDSFKIAQQRKRSPESVLALSCTKVEDYPHELQHGAVN